MKIITRNKGSFDASELKGFLKNVPDFCSVNVEDASSGSKMLQTIMYDDRKGAITLIVKDL